MSSRSIHCQVFGNKSFLDLINIFVKFLIKSYKVQTIELKQGVLKKKKSVKYCHLYLVAYKLL